MDFFFFIARGERVRVLYDSKRTARVALGFTHARRNIALAHNCNELVSRSKCNFHVSVHHVFGHAGKAGNECADIAESMGMESFISESNVLSWWPTRLFHLQRLLSVPRCLSGVAGVLHSIVAGIAVGIALCLFQLFFFSQKPLVGFFDVRLPHLIFVAVAPPIPATCLRSDVVAGSKAPKREGHRRSPSAWECHVQCTRCSLCRHALRVSRHNACGPSSTRICEP